MLFPTTHHESDIVLPRHRRSRFVKDPSMRSISITLALLLLAVLAGGCATYGGPFVAEAGVVFKVRAPGAKQVHIVGSFNRWDRQKDALSGPDNNGWWIITLPLAPGRHEYLFLVDGATWLPDPSAPGRTDDGYGGKNSILYLGR